VDGDDPRGSAVPVSWRNALSWRWAPEMPRPLKGGFLTVLYAAGAMADASGRLRFKDGRTITRKQLAGAAGSDLREASRYAHAAVAAGVLGIEGEQKNGAAPLYLLLLNPCPDWSAAVASLESTRRKRPKKPPPWRAETGPDQRGPAPPVDEPDQRGPAPLVREQDPKVTERDRPPTDQRGPAPHDQRGPAPPQPRETQGNPHVLVDVDDQRAGVAHAREAAKIDFKSCEKCDAVLDRDGTCFVCAPVRSSGAWP